MPATLRDGFVDVARKAAADTRAHGLTVEKEALAQLKDKGVTVIDCDREAFRKRVAPQSEDFVKARPEAKPVVESDPRHVGVTMQDVADSLPGAQTGARGRATGALLVLTDIAAAGLLAADLAVVIYSVLARSLFVAPVEWADDVARGLMVASGFFGAAPRLPAAKIPA